MLFTTSEIEGEVVHVKLVLSPPPPNNSLLTVPRLLWFSVACFGDVSLYVCSYYI